MPDGGMFDVFGGKASNQHHGGGHHDQNEIGAAVTEAIKKVWSTQAGTLSEKRVHEMLTEAFAHYEKHRQDHARNEIVDSHFQQITPFIPAAVTVPAGGVTGILTSNTGSLESSPQRDFQGERLVLDSLLGETGLPLWAVGNINIGADPQFTTPVGQAPSRGFDPLAVGVRLRMTLMRAQTQLSIPVILYNLNGGTPPTAYSDILTAMLIGPAVTPSLAR